MTDQPAPDKAGDQHRRDARGRWKPGVAGNPAGRPRGSRHRTSMAIEALLEGEAEGLTRKALELALAGDITALKLCIDRLCPPPRDRRIMFALPEVEGGDLSTVTQALLTSVAEGELSPLEADSVAKLVEAHRRTLETVQLEQRLAALEERSGR